MLFTRTQSENKILHTVCTYGEGIVIQDSGNHLQLHIHQTSGLQLANGGAPFKEDRPADQCPPLRHAEAMLVTDIKHPALSTPKAWLTFFYRLFWTPQ